MILQPGPRREPDVLQHHSSEILVVAVDCFSRPVLMPRMRRRASDAPDPQRTDVSVVPWEDRR